MDFLIEEKGLDIAVLKCQNEIKITNDMFLIESNTDSFNTDIAREVFDKQKEKTSFSIANIIEAIKKFIKEIGKKIDIKIQQIKLNNKLKELKDLLAKKRAKALGQKYNYIDMKRYKKYYAEFINRYTAELKKGLNKDFRNASEYEAWRTDMLHRLDDFNYKITDEEQWRLSTTINSAVELSETELKNKDSNLKMVEQTGSASIKKLEQYYKKIDVENSAVNNNSLHVFKSKNSFISMICGKIASIVKNVAKFISKHIIGTILAIIGILIIL